MKESVKSDAEFSSQVDLVSKRKKEEINLESIFMKDCLPFVGMDKCLKLEGLAKDFQRELMEKLPDRRKDDHGPPPASPWKKY